MKKTCLIYGMPTEQLPFGYDEEDFRCMIMKLKIAEKIYDLVQEDVIVFICDCEYGIPLWSAEAVLKQRSYNPNIRLEIYMPYEEQAAKWAPEWRNRYFSVHEQADDVRIYNDYELCRRELFNDADILIYVGNNAPETICGFRDTGKMIYTVEV